MLLKSVNLRKNYRVAYFLIYIFKYFFRFIQLRFRLDFGFIKTTFKSLKLIQDKIS